MTSSNINDDEDNNMTPEERLEWLRSRGVLVETSEERKAKELLLKQQQQQALNSNLSGDQVKFVLIPADSAKDIEQKWMPLNNDVKGVDLLETYLKPVFSAAGSSYIDIDMLKKQASNHFGTENIPSISDASLRNAAAQGSVESFRLVPAMESNKFQMINFYLDEVGVMKKLPLNTRASHFALKAGFNPPPKFFGDIYVGRLKTKPVLKNVDFILGEDTSLDYAPWLKNAISENLNHQSQMNKLTGRVNELQPIGNGEDGQEVEEDGFSWTQTSDEIEFRFELTENTVSKDVKVKFMPSSLTLLVREECHEKLNLFAHIDPDGCTWTFEKGKATSAVIVSCEKVEATNWPTALK